MSGGWQAGLAANIGAAGFGGAVQGFDVGQLVAFAKSGVTVADLHLCIFDCAKGEAESEGLPANDLTLVSLCRIVALDGVHDWIF